MKDHDEGTFKESVYRKAKILTEYMDSDYYDKRGYRSCVTCVDQNDYDFKSEMETILKKAAMEIEGLVLGKIEAMESEYKKMVELLDQRCEMQGRQPYESAGRGHSATVFAL